MKPISTEDVKLICSEVKPYFEADLETRGRANVMMDDGCLFPSVLFRLVGRHFKCFNNFNFHIWIKKGVRGKYKYAFHLQHKDGFILSEGMPIGRRSIKERVDWEWRKVLIEKIRPMKELNIRF